MHDCTIKSALPKVITVLINNKCDSLFKVVCLPEQS